MPKKPNEPRLCTVCDRVWQLEKRTTTVDMIRRRYFEVIYHPDFPRFKIEKETCTYCLQVPA